MNQSEKPYVPHTIAIDGPVASGKTTVGLLLAKELGYICLDTGIMYRAVAQKVLDLGISPIDEVAVTQVAQVTDIDVREPSVQDGRQFDVLIDGADRTWDIRTREVNACVSEVSVFPGVRDAMTLQQRRIAERSPIVMLGRDIGTVVLPNADLKIFLKASAMVRAKRRYEEERALGRDVRLEDVLEFLIVGATAVQVGTANFMQPGCSAEIAGELKRFCQERGDTLTDWIGSLQVEQ